MLLLTISILYSQILFSKYHPPLKEIKAPWRNGEMVDSRSEAEKEQGEPGRSYARKEGSV